MVVCFGQVVLGAAGAGKTTYCKGMQHLLELQKRECLVVNLDPANDTYDYECALDVRDLVDAKQVEEDLRIGPNGALVFCMEYLEKNVDWLQEQLQKLKQKHTPSNQTTKDKDTYVLFDCPGQVELFALHTSFRRILDVLAKTLDFRFVCVHCVDVQLCTDPNNYMAAILLSLNVMLNLELPHVNVLTKCDMISRFAQLEMPFEYYLDAQNLEQLLLGENQGEGKGVMMGQVRNFGKLTLGLCELIEDFALVNFQPVAVEDGHSMQHLLKTLDRCLGYVSHGTGSGRVQGSSMSNDERQNFIQSLETIDTPDWHEHFQRFNANRKRHIEEESIKKNSNNSTTR